MLQANLDWATYTWNEAPTSGRGGIEPTCVMRYSMREQCLPEDIEPMPTTDADMVCDFVDTPTRA